MKWQFEICDVPLNIDYPIEGFQLNEAGVRRGPFYFKVEDLVDALLQSPENAYDADSDKADEQATPTLPLGTIRYSKNLKGTKQRVTMVLDKKIWDVRYGNESDFYSIGFPKLILQYLVVDSGINLRIAEMRIYAVEDNGQPITEETPLYTFPFPNVGKGNGIVCWGQNERLEIQSLVELERAFGWFVAAPFNEDHGVRTTLGINRFNQLITRIKDQSFDDEWLMPSGNTFGDLFKN